MLWLLIPLDFLAVFFIVFRGKFGGNLAVEGGKGTGTYSINARMKQPVKEKVNYK